MKELDTAQWPRIWPLHMETPGWDVPSPWAVSPLLPQLRVSGVSVTAVSLSVSVTGSAGRGTGSGRGAGQDCSAMPSVTSLL